MDINITLFIVIATTIISLLAFSNHRIFDELFFWPYRIWRNNEWYRLVSCSFIHADLAHLAFNMFALYSFGNYVEWMFRGIFPGKGLTMFIIMYFLAVATADIYNLFMRRDDYGYRSLGASGGVSAIVFSYILFQPYGRISIYFLPGIPAVIFGILYLFYCVYMANRGRDNIGHIAHFTGSIFGFVFPIIFKPSLLVDFIHQIMGR
ncbi:MAG TPA: rhomboid family intramembrane serine protease [Chitinophagales bacterium]|nr:rhomboid family intramembrane serine protease [Chitinophagales bacterium]